METRRVAAQAKAGLGLLARRGASALAAILVLCLSAPSAFAYNYSKSITIDRSKISDASCGATLSNYPMLFSVTDANLKNTGSGGRVTDPAGDDIIFRAFDTTTCGGPAACTLDHQIEKYVDTTGELVAWVRLPSVNASGAGSDTVIYVYYGDSTVTSPTENPTGVWDANFKGVWHLKETDIDGGSGDIKDSTGNLNNGTTSGINASAQVAGKIDGSFDFGGAGIVTVPDASSLNITTSPITMEAWVNASSYDGKGANEVMGKKMYEIYIDNGALCAFYETNAGGKGSKYDDCPGTQTMVTGTWYHVAAIYNAGSVETYINGVLDGSFCCLGTGLLDSAGSDFIQGNCDGKGCKHWDGKLDEIRVSNTARSACSLKTSYNNQVWPNKAVTPSPNPSPDPTGGFYTVGAETPTTPGVPGGFNAYETSTAAGAITGVIKTKIAGSSISLDVIALNTAKTAIETAFTGTVRVEVLNASNNSGALDGNGCRSTWSVIQTLSDPTFNFGDLGRKSISFTQANSYPEARLKIYYPVTSPTGIGCSTDNFAIRPNTLASLAVTDTDWQTAGTGRALTEVTFGTVIHKTGRPLSARATAVNAAGTPATTTNYTGAPAATLTACVGAACTATFGTLTLATTFAAGQLASDVASYDNVGSYRLQLVDSSFANVDASDGSTTTERYITSAVIDVGRFVPDHFAVSLNAPLFGTACGSFTYIGQVFNYTTAPVITVTAQGFANNTTTLYADSAKWWRITNASVTPGTQAARYSAASGTLDLAGLPAVGGDPMIAPSGSGVGTLTFGSGTGLSFTRTTPLAPFDADISLAINVIDADNVAYASNPARFAQAAAGLGITFSGSKAQRFGRLRLENAVGSQNTALPVQIHTQYWNGSGFATNTADSCTSIPRSAIVAGGYVGALDPGGGNCKTFIEQDPVTFTAGVGAITLALPTGAASGSVLLTPNLSSTASGLYCDDAASGENAATAAALSHLQGRWAGANYTDNPSARAAFGLYGAQPRQFIYFRENY